MEAIEIYKNAPELGDGHSFVCQARTMLVVRIRLCISHARNHCGMTASQAMPLPNRNEGKCSEVLGPDSLDLRGASSRSSANFLYHPSRNT